MHGEDCPGGLFDDTYFFGDANIAMPEVRQTLIGFMAYLRTRGDTVSEEDAERSGLTMFASAFLRIAVLVMPIC